MRSSLLLLSFLFLIVMPASGQSLLERAKKRAAARLEERADRKMTEEIDREIDHGLDALEEMLAEEADKDSSRADRRDELPGFAMEEAEHARSYHFDHAVDMESRSYDGGQLEQSQPYTLLLAEQSPYLALVAPLSTDDDAQTSYNIFDLEEQSMISLMEQDGVKMGFQISYDEALDMATEEETDLQIRATGRTKDILGYRSLEYEVKDEESYHLVWLTEALPWPNFYEAFSHLKKDQQAMPLPEGFMMAMTSWPEGREGDERVEMKVTRINRQTPREINTAGYRIIKMKQ